MFCTNCGNKIEEGNKFCPSCGTPANNTQTNNQSTNNGLVLGNFDYDKYEEAYVGEKYNTLKNKTFSWSAFFLGPVYLAYRKMYMYAIIAIIAGLLVGVFIPIPLVVELLYGFMTIKLYFNDVHSKVSQLKLKNSELSEDQLLELCRKKGGVSLAGAILFFVAIVLFVVAIVFLFAFLFTSVIKEGEKNIPEFSEIIKDYTEEESEEEDNYSYNKEGMIGTNTIIKFIIPDKYKREDDNVESYHYIEGNTKCSFSASLIINNNNPEEYLREQYPETTINNETHSDINFKTAFEREDEIYSYDLATTYDNDTYLFSFNDISDTSEICSSLRNKILNSLEVTKLVEDEEEYSNLKEVSYSEFNNKINNLESFIVLFSKRTCPHCRSYKPKLNKVLSENNLNAYVVDLDSLNQDDYKDFNSKFYITGTPTTVFIERGTETSIGDRLVGDVTEEKILERLKGLNYIESTDNIESNA